jgi:tRNA 5-methylaminomethyl-2-thiouridine biosynthesis bifunctional protein
MSRDDGIRALLAAAGLPRAWSGRASFTVLDAAFGDGRAFTATLAAWRADPARCARLHYAALLERPLRREALAAASRHDDALARELLARWPPPVAGVHRLEFDGVRATLSLAIGPARAMLPGWVPHADALIVRLDAPGPAPEAGALRTAAAALARGAAIAVGAVGAPDRTPRPDPRAARETHDGRVPAGPRSPTGDEAARREASLAVLAAAGFEPDPGGPAVGAGADGPHGSSPTGSGPAVRLLRTRGPSAGRAGVQASGGVGAPAASRAAIVVGAGLAGCAVAFALARRGWSVVRLDASDAAGGSWQPVLAEHPSVTVDDAPLARLARAATLLARGPFDRGAHRVIGRLQTMDAASARAAVGALAPEWVRAVDAREASERAGIALASGGLWLPAAAAANPHALREAWTTGDLAARDGVRVSSLRRTRDGWCALDARGAVLAEAPQVVVATGAAGADLRVEARCAASGPRPSRTVAAHLGPAGLSRRTGCTTLARPATGALPACIVGGDGHAVPVGDGRLLLGPRADASAEAAWSRWCARLLEPADAADLVDGPAGERLSARDHLPLAGPVPDADAIGALARRDDRDALPALPGLWIAAAFGGRGLLWSVLAAETIAARLDGEPAPLERALRAAIAPDRFLRRARRRAPGTDEGIGDDGTAGNGTDDDDTAG